MMDKKTFSERDICSKFITPAVIAAGWDLNNRFVALIYLRNNSSIFNVIRGIAMNAVTSQKMSFNFLVKNDASD
jgi:type I site-specific restriction endonuclease